MILLIYLEDDPQKHKLTNKNIVVISLVISHQPKDNITSISPKNAPVQKKNLFVPFSLYIFFSQCLFAALMNKLMNANGLHFCSFFFTLVYCS